jgi:CRISPR/Cas system Type II protein with McrA/HNH and RuvC-like nuclease domain
MRKVLVLNNAYLPVAVVSVEKAVTLIYLGKAQIVHAQENRMMRSIKTEYPFPDVIRLFKYVSIPFKRASPSKRNIFLRDSYTCQYCGSTVKANLTIDHVMPISRGGKDTFENMVTACSSCNRKKGNMTPEEAGMPLMNPIINSNYFSLLRGYKRKNWNEYLIH